ncbi:hypothetical protein [Altererythrobacter sp. Root672]|uniref:hypothetical protein n=1 Tax=Altererythrobacter sp. Root672 TaxID=1736584 RepID=UPI0006FDAACD|nr:hypothetical protein [Altererythrobacter sp. Root672]
MNETPADFLRLAAAARLEAVNVVLENVRQKHLISAQTLEGLAQLASEVTKVRATRLATARDVSP